MSRGNIGHRKPGKEPPDDGERVISNVATLGAPHKQRRSLEPDFIRVLEGEVRHVVERRREVLDREAEVQVLLAISRSDEVREEELADGEGLVGAR